jgi:hypothetical protein
MEIMPRKPIGETAMTDAERQARYRAARAAGKPVIRIRRALDHRGRARRWTDHVTGLVESQVEFAAWLDSLPENLRDSPLAEALQAICDLDLTELQAIIPPRGFGRDCPPSPRGLHRWVHRPPPARRCVSLLMGTQRRAGPPYGLPAQAATWGVNFGRR